MAEPSVEALAQLACLAFTPEEKERYAKEFPEIVAYVGKVQEVLGSNRPLTSTITGVRHIVREDAVVSSDLADVLLQQAPSVERGQVKVPVVL